MQLVLSLTVPLYIIPFHYFFIVGIGRRLDHFEVYDTGIGRRLNRISDIY